MNRWTNLCVVRCKRRCLCAAESVAEGVVEALHVLKRDGVRDADRHAELERLLGARVPDERFAALVARGKRVTDFDAGGAGAGAGGDGGGGDGRARMSAMSAPTWRGVAADEWCAGK